MESLDQSVQQQLNCLLHNLPKFLKWGILLLASLLFMRAGKGTYGSKVGRPKKKKDDKKKSSKKNKLMALKLSKK